MRDSLTVLAILLILLLTAALIGPYFVDWNAHRAAIERKLSEAAGARVVISGAIDVKLLPQPTFKLGRVAIIGSDPEGQKLTAESVDVEVALTALMRGEIEVADATLRSPYLELNVAENGGLPFPVATVANPDRVRFQRLTVSNGTLMVKDPVRGGWSLSGIDLRGEAASLYGPFKAEGRFGADGDPHPFRFASGAFDGTRLRVKLGLDGKGQRPAVELDGSILRGGATASHGRVNARPSFDGTVTLAGSVLLPDNPAIVPWRFAGQVESDGTKTVGTDLEFRAGADLRALVATGAGEADAGAAPAAARLRLHGGQLDLDALAVAPDNQSIAAPKGPDLLARLAGLANTSDGFATLPFGLDLDLSLDTAAIASRTLSDIKVKVHGGGKPSATVKLSARGPEGAEIAIDGTLDPGPAAVFRGHVDASVRDLPRMTAWLAPVVPQFGSWAKRFLPLRGVSFAGGVEASAIGGIARDVTLALDRSILTGAVSYTRSVGTERARIFADLTSDALDLDAVPSLTGAASALGALDLSVALSARSVKFGRGLLGPVDAGRMALRLTRTGPDLRLDELTADLGSVKLAASGRIEGKLAQGELRVDAGQVDALASVLDRVFPGALTAVLRERGPALMPAMVTMRAQASISPDGTLLPTNLRIDGTVSGTQVAAELKPDKPGPDLDPWTMPLSATFKAEASDSASLLRQLGMAAAGGPPLGRGRFEGTAHGSFAAGFEVGTEAALGASTITFTGKAKPELGTGRLAARGADFGPLLRAAGLSPAGATQPIPVEADGDLSWHDASLALHRISGRLGATTFSGDLNAELGSATDVRRRRAALFGALALDRAPASALFGLVLGAPQPASGGAPWSDRPFEPPTAVLPRTEVTLKIGALDLAGATEARNTSLTLRADAGAITLADFTGMMADGGSLGANLTLRRDGPGASVAGRVTWTNIALHVPGMAGRMGGALDVAGSGASPSALVGSLAGTGSLNLAGAAIANADPEAMARTSAALDRKAAADPTATLADADDVAHSLEAELDRNPLPVGDTSGAATLALGVLRTGPFRVGTPSWTAEVGASVDLRTLVLDSRTTLQWRGPAPGVSGGATRFTITLKGPLASPTREVDASTFVNALQARAIARDQERIEVLQQDIRERAFFNRRLKAIEADQQAARDRAKANKAEADAVRSIETETDRQRALEDARRILDPDAGRLSRDLGPPAPEAGRNERRAPVKRGVPGSRTGGSKPIPLRSPPGGSDPGSPASSATDPARAGR